MCHLVDAASHLPGLRSDLSKDGQVEVLGVFCYGFPQPQAPLMQALPHKFSETVHHVPVVILKALTNSLTLFH